MTGDLPWLRFRVVVFPTKDPWGNLALEETLFGALAPGENLFLMYINHPCVVLGKHQNPWREVNLSEARRRGLPVIRRFSGGGAVYHDSGNLNFSFLCWKQDYRREGVHRFFQETLGLWGWAMEVGDKGDFLWSGRKFSGQAYAYRQDRVLHHGTLLVDADLGNLKGVLGGEDLVEWVGVPSRPMPVVNLSEGRSDWTAPRLAAALEEAMRRAGAQAETGNLGGGQRSSAPFAENLDRLRSEDWLWGQSPPFTWGTQWRGKDIRVRVEEGRAVRVWEPATGTELAVPEGWFDPGSFL